MLEQRSESVVLRGGAVSAVPAARGNLLKVLVPALAHAELCLQSCDDFRGRLHPAIFANGQVMGTRVKGLGKKEKRECRTVSDVPWAEQQVEMYKSLGIDRFQRSCNRAVADSRRRLRHGGERSGHFVERCSWGAKKSG